MNEVKKHNAFLKKIVDEVLSIRESLPNGELPKEVERGEIYSLVNLYAEHAAMFEILSERVLNVKLNELYNNTKIKKIKKKLKKQGKLDKKQLDELKELVKDAPEVDNETKKIIDELIELKDTKRHIAVDRLRASSEKKGRQPKKNLRAAARKKDEYKTSNSLNSFQGIQNSIHITDIHNDMYHFLLGMTEPIGDPLVAAFKIGDPTTKIEEVGDKEYMYPNLVYNPEFKGTITFGGDLIQSHDSGVNDNLGAIPLCLVMRDCMRQANYEIDEEMGRYKKLDPPIVYVAGNHELEAINEGQHPEVRVIMQDMFKEGLVEYCHYDKNSDTFISHTKLNKNLIEVIGNNIDGYGGLFDGEKPNRTLKKIESPEQREQLAKLLNENFAKTSKDIKIKDNALFDPGPEGISDFAIVGEELERTYFRTDKTKNEDCEEARGRFTKENLDKLKILKDLARALKKQGKDLGVDNFNDLNKDNSNNKLNKLFGNGEEKEINTDDNYKIKLIRQKDGNIGISLPDNKFFSLEEAGQLFAKAITLNPNSRPYSLMNRGALLNFSGGLHGYDDKEKDYTEEALDLGCNHVVGHRPTLLDPEGRYGSRNFTSLNVPIAIKMGNETTLQTDYNGKNEDKYVNCRITKFDSKGKPHLVGVSKILEEHKNFFKKNIEEDAKKLCDDAFLSDSSSQKDNKDKQNKFIDYIISNPLPVKKMIVIRTIDKTKLDEYFKKAGEKCGLKVKNNVNFAKIVEKYSLAKQYSKAFAKNKTKIIDKQERIVAASRGLEQKQRGS